MLALYDSSTSAPANGNGNEMRPPDSPMSIAGSSSDEDLAANTMLDSLRRRYEGVYILGGNNMGLEELIRQLDDGRPEEATLQPQEDWDGPSSSESPFDDDDDEDNERIASAPRPQQPLWPEQLTTRLRLQKFAFFEHRYLSSSLRVVSERFKLPKRSALYRELHKFVRDAQEQLYQRGLLDRQFANIVLGGTRPASNNNNSPPPDVPPPVGAEDTDEDEYVVTFRKFMQGPGMNSFSSVWLDTVTRHRRLRGAPLESPFETEWLHQCTQTGQSVLLSDKLDNVNRLQPRKHYEKHQKRIAAYQLLCRLLRCRAVALAEYVSDMCEFSWHMLRRDWDRGRDVFPQKDFDDDMMYFVLDQAGTALRSPIIGICAQLQQLYQDAFDTSLETLHEQVCELDHCGGAAPSRKPAL